MTDIANKQPLDYESELLRRQITEKVINLKSSIACIKKRLSLMESICFFEDDVTNKPQKSYYSNAHLARNATKNANIAFFTALKTSYENASCEADNVDRLIGRVKVMKKKLSTSKEKKDSSKHDKAPGNIKGFKKKGDFSNTNSSRKKRFLSPCATTFSSPLTVPKNFETKGSFTKHKSPLLMTDIEKRVRMIAAEPNKVQTKKFTRDVHALSDSIAQQRSLVNTRRSVDSRLMKSFDSSSSNKQDDVIQHPFSYPSSTLTSKPSASDSAQAKAESLDMGSVKFSFDAPSKKVDISTMAREALSIFGTTPEKTNKIREAKLREGEKSRQAAINATTNTSRETNEIAFKSSSTTFPVLVQGSALKFNASNRTYSVAQSSRKHQVV